MPLLRAGMAVLLGAAALSCAGREPNNPAELVLVNRTGSAVTGAVLRFDRELARVDRLDRGGGPFAEVRLRVSPADTLTLGAGRLEPRARAYYAVTGRGGAPRLKEARWIVAKRVGPPLGPDEARVK